MKLTIIIALAIFAGTVSGQGAIAQQLRTASAPAEVPPSSYQGRQYVDSRGCVYIRAGIDGVVNWVPRVERNRRQVCGFEPTNIAGASAPVARPAAGTPELITLPEADRPATNTPAVAPRVTQQKPRRAAPMPKSASVPKPQAAAPQPHRVKRIEAAPLVIETAPQTPAPSVAGCAGLSGVSRQYTNTSGVRCGPQTQSPVTFGPQSSLQLPADTRVLPAHLQTDRQQAAGVTVPKGYRAVWQDGRLNPKRAEQDLYPQGSAPQTVPSGFARVPSSLPRFNPDRGPRTAAADQSMAQVWTDTLPRKLKVVPASQVVTVANRSQQTPAQLGFLSQEASQQLAAPVRYVRAATFADPVKAQDAAKELTAAGLPVRMGHVTRKGQVMKVVLVGPLRGDQAARAALTAVQKKGFSAARLSK